jgi:hypothetical protein
MMNIYAAPVLIKTMWICIFIVYSDVIIIVIILRKIEIISLSEDTTDSPS